MYMYIYKHTCIYLYAYVSSVLFPFSEVMFIPVIFFFVRSSNNFVIDWHSLRNLHLVSCTSDLDSELPS